MERFLDWLLTVFIGAIVVIFAWGIAHCEIITENRDGVVYIYNCPNRLNRTCPNKAPGVDTQVSKQIESYGIFGENHGYGEDTTPTVSITQEEESLIKAQENLNLKNYSYAFDYFRRAGDYERAMGVLNKLIEREKEVLKENPETWTSLEYFYKQAGDWEEYVTSIRIDAEKYEADGCFLNAIFAYEQIFNTKKVKEMYKLQQEKARKTLVE